MSHTIHDLFGDTDAHNNKKKKECVCVRESNLKSIMSNVLSKEETSFGLTTKQNDLIFLCVFQEVTSYDVPVVKLKNGIPCCCSSKMPSCQ